MSSGLGLARSCLIILLGAVGGRIAGAQTAAGLHSGEWLISGSGSIGRDHDGTTGTDVTHMSIAPSALVFLTNRFAVGGSVGLSYSSLTGSNSHAIGIGPAARYYFASGADGWLPFAAASVMPRWTTTNSTTTLVGTSSSLSSTSFSSSAHSTTFDGSVGLTRLLERHVGVTGEAYYTRLEFSSSVALRPSYDIGARFGLSIFVH